MSEINKVSEQKLTTTTSKERSLSPSPSQRKRATSSTSSTIKVATKSSANWSELPGSFDTTNARRGVFPSDNQWGIPTIWPVKLALPQQVSQLTPTSTPTSLSSSAPAWLVPFRTRVRDEDAARQGGVHFFLDDYQFEAVWSRPVKSLSYLKHYGAVLTPDFSLFRDWPLAVQLWNTYRNRWLGAWWQAQGLQVIPTVSWSTPQSYEFCFAGLAQAQVQVHGLEATDPFGDKVEARVEARVDRAMRPSVAISNIGISHKDYTAVALFEQGYYEMLERLRPGLVLWYGDRVEERYQTITEQKLGKGYCQIVSYTTHWGNRAQS